jgi:hypothetical protein
MVGAYSIVTMHDFFGPRLVPVHVSAVFENTDPVKEIVSADEAPAPELVNVNVCDAVLPATAATAPKL